MWIMSKTGFISVVKHNDPSTDDLLVRARAAEDIEDLLESVAIDGYDLTNIEIEIDLDADYWFRARVPRQVVVTAIAQQLDEIDYTTNVKGTIDKGDADRHKALMSTWTAWFKFQERYQADVERVVDMRLEDLGFEVER